MTRPELRKTVRRAMREAGIPTVTKLVEQAGISRNTLYNWEGGKSSPALDELDRLARTLSVPLSELVDAWAGRDAEKEPLAPVWAERLQASIEAVYERQMQVGQDMAGKVIEALASPGQQEWAERIAARLAAPPTQSSEASGDRPGTEAPGAGTPIGRVPE